MQPYPTVQNYAGYFNQPYQERLNNMLQNQYQQTQPQLNQGILWVQGEAGAKSYLVAPNATVLLMDSESQRFYLKSTDGSGIPSLRVFEYSEVSPNNTQVAIATPDKYVTREEYQSLSNKYDEILAKLNSFTEADTKAKSKTKGGSADE